MQKNLFPSYSIVSSWSLLNDTGRGSGRVKLTNCNKVEWGEKCHFASDILFEWHLIPNRNISICWKICKLKLFGCVLGACYFQFQWVEIRKMSHVFWAKLYDEWSFWLVFIGFEIFCYKFWNKKTLMMSTGMCELKLYARKNIFKKRIKNEILNHLGIFWVQVSFLGGLL